jgi:hypothetical protein
MLNELRHVLFFDGGYINYRHMSMLVDVMVRHSTQSHSYVCTPVLLVVMPFLYCIYLHSLDREACIVSPCCCVVTTPDQPHPTRPHSICLTLSLPLPLPARRPSAAR